ncbi:MAG: hypothetical protein ACI4V3_09935 [Faecousia sp.]
MKQENYTERDWQLFRSRIPQWQEAYIGKLNEEYVSLLPPTGMHLKNFGHCKNGSKKTGRVSACVWK